MIPFFLIPLLVSGTAYCGVKHVQNEKEKNDIEKAKLALEVYDRLPKEKKEAIGNHFTK